MALELLDKLFFVFHTFVLLFNMFGWAWRKTRKANLALLLLTAFSWFGLGIFYGVGYCPCTDWHWAVRARLGHADMPASYIKFLVDSITGLDFDPGLVDIVTGAGFFLAMAASISLNYRDWKLSGKDNAGHETS